MCCNCDLFSSPESTPNSLHKSSVRMYFGLLFCLLLFLLPPRLKMPTRIIQCLCTQRRWNQSCSSRFSLAVFLRFWSRVGFSFKRHKQQAASTMSLTRAWMCVSRSALHSLRQCKCSSARAPLHAHAHARTHAHAWKREKRTKAFVLPPPSALFLCRVRSAVCVCCGGDTTAASNATCWRC